MDRFFLQEVTMVVLVLVLVGAFVLRRHLLKRRAKREERTRAVMQRLKELEL